MISNHAGQGERVDNTEPRHERGGHTEATLRCMPISAMAPSRQIVTGLAGGNRTPPPRASQAMLPGTPSRATATFSSSESPRQHQTPARAPRPRCEGDYSALSQPRAPPHQLLATSGANPRWPISLRRTLQDDMHRLPPSRIPASRGSRAPPRQARGAPWRPRNGRLRIPAKAWCGPARKMQVTRAKHWRASALASLGAPLQQGSTNDRRANALPGNRKMRPTIPCSFSMMALTGVSATWENRPAIACPAAQRPACSQPPSAQYIAESDTTKPL